VTEDLGGTEYRGLSGIARNSAWLDNTNIPHDKDTRVVIERVFFHKSIKFGPRPAETNRLSVKFVGSEKRLLLNTTNKKTLDALFTPVVGEWYGKAIALFVVHGVHLPGTKDEKVSAIRIRAKRLDQKAATAPLNPIEAPAPEDPQPGTVESADAEFEEAARRAEAGGTTMRATP